MMGPMRERCARLRLLQISGQMSVMKAFHASGGSVMRPIRTKRGSATGHTPVRIANNYLYARSYLCFYQIQRRSRLHLPGKLQATATNRQDRTRTDSHDLDYTVLEPDNLSHVWTLSVPYYDGKSHSHNFQKTCVSVHEHSFKSY